MKNSLKISTVAILALFAGNSLVSAMASVSVETHIAPVCALQHVVILSKKAVAACNGDAKAMPRLTKNGSRLTKGRTGAEFNAIIRNIAAFSQDISSTTAKHGAGR